MERCLIVHSLLCLIELCLIEHILFAVIRHSTFEAHLCLLTTFVRCSMRGINLEPIWLHVVLETCHAFNTFTRCQRFPQGGYFSTVRKAKNSRGVNLVARWFQELALAGSGRSSQVSGTTKRKKSQVHCNSLLFVT